MGTLTSELLRCIYKDIDDYKAKINDDALDIEETCVMVLKNCGPKGYPGMAEVGNMGLPPKILKKGITDMVRISDARMSGTAYGTVILHTSPEAADGGPLAVVPGSHALPLGPLEMLRCPFRSSMTLDATLPQAAMPNHYKFAAKAGTALIFDLATWHTAMPCLPGQPDRRCAIIGWGGAGGAGASLSTERLVEVEAAKRLTPTLRRLLGLGAAASQ